MSAYSTINPLSLGAGKHRGVGLLELLLGVFIGAIILAAAVMLFGNSHQKVVEAEMRQELMDIIRVTHEMYDNQANYDDISPTMLYSSGDMPRKWKNGDTLWVPGGGIVGMSAQGKRFNVTLYGLSRQSCLAAARINLVPLAVAAEINDTVSTDDGSPVDIQTANTACGDSNNHVGWNFM